MEKPTKIFIIDDEYLVRNLIRKCVNWSEMGVEIIGEASNALEAEKLISQAKPDIILTDICMPVKDGLEMSEALLRKHPDIKIIVITGYDDLEYAKKCIRLGISDFIVKPINDEELRSAVLKLQEEIRRNRSKEQELIFLKQKVKDLGISFTLEGQGKKAEGSICIEEIKEYILQNISDTKLSLKTVAEHFYINPSYMSRMFKSRTGQNFSDYILEVKMNLAIKLVRETSLKSYQIARHIGIDDPNYFSTCFKKYTGVSIKEFRSMET